MSATRGASFLVRLTEEGGVNRKAWQPPGANAARGLSGAGVGAVLFVCIEPHQLPAVEAASGRLLWQ